MNKLSDLQNVRNVKSFQEIHYWGAESSVSLLMVVKSFTAGLLVNNLLSIVDVAWEKTEKTLKELSNLQLFSSSATCLSFVPDPIEKLQ